MMVVTGGAGFIGSHLARRLAEQGAEVLVVDSFDGGDLRTLADLPIVDLIPPDALLDLLAERSASIDAVFHQGAITDTTCDDHALLAERNVRFSLALGRAAAARALPFIYASSASVYGLDGAGPVSSRTLAPLNPYAASKLVVDRALASTMADATAPFVGLRYYNVYGPGEQHKGAMASIVQQAMGQLRTEGVIRLFDGCPDGDAQGIRRDWITVDDVVAVNLALLDGAPHGAPRGVLDVGTGVAVSFETVAELVIAAYGSGRIEHIAFPDHLRGRYQHHTQADLSGLQAVGIDRGFTPVEVGVPACVETLLATRPAT